MNPLRWPVVECVEQVRELEACEVELSWCSIFVALQEIRESLLNGICSSLIVAIILIRNALDIGQSHAVC